MPAYNEVFQAWKVAAILGLQSSTRPEMRRETLRLALSADWPSQVEGNSHGTQIVLSRKGVGDRVSGYWAPGKGAPMLVVHPGGSAAALRTEAVQKMLHSGRPVLVIDPFTSARVRLDRERFDRYFLSYNRSDDANRVQDILTALAFLKGQGKGKTELIGMGNAGVWCVFAAAIAPVGIDLVADLNGFGGSDKDFHDRFFVPGIQRAGGLSIALGLVARIQTVIPTEAKAELPAEH